MPHRIDWTNQRGRECIEHYIGARHCTQMPMIGPIIFDLMESIGQFRLATIEKELHSRGWSMKKHTTTVRDIKSVIWFVNASDTSGYWCKQIRVTTSTGNAFIWRVEHCGLIQKEMYWRAETQHAMRSIPATARKPQLFEATIEPISNDQFESPPPAQSIELDFTESVTIRDLQSDS